jgi:hypothetical protein
MGHLSEYHISGHTGEENWLKVVYGGKFHGPVLVLEDHYELQTHLGVFKRNDKMGLPELGLNSKLFSI